MIDADTLPPLDGTHLPALLARLAGLPTPVPPDRVIERLGQSLDMASSIRLANALGRLPRARALEPAVLEDVRVLLDTLQQTRRQLTQQIEQSRLPERRGTRMGLPRIDTVDDTGEGLRFAAWQRYHGIHQREFDFRLSGLRTDVRALVANASPRLARLAELDRLHAETVLSGAGRLFAQIPKFLAARFSVLQAEAEANWLARFEDELLQILKAELDLRMLPIQGLLEAVHESTV